MGKNSGSSGSATAKLLPPIFLHPIHHPATQIHLPILTLRLYEHPRGEHSHLSLPPPPSLPPQNGQTTESLRLVRNIRFPLPPLHLLSLIRMHQFPSATLPTSPEGSPAPLGTLLALLLRHDHIYSHGDQQGARDTQHSSCLGQSLAPYCSALPPPALQIEHKSSSPGWLHANANQLPKDAPASRRPTAGHSRIPRGYWPAAATCPLPGCLLSP